MIKNKKGSVSVLGIYLCYLAIFLAIVSKTIIMSNISYYQENYHKYNLFMIENAIITNIYQDYRDVNYSSKRLSYTSTMNNKDGDYIYKIKVSIDQDLYVYEARYDHECEQLIEFNNISRSDSI